MQIEGNTYFTTKELSEYFGSIGFIRGSKESNLRSWRSNKSNIKGPNYVKLAGQILYPYGEVESFLLDVQTIINK